MENNQPVKTPTFDISAILRDDGYDVTDINDDGSVSFVDTATGKKGRLDNVKLYAAQYLQEKDPDSLEIYQKNLNSVSFNSPTDPIQKSPLTTLERAKLTLGNIGGNVNYLKNKYGKDGVRVNDSGELIVRDKGFWKTIDPSGMGKGDAGDLAKELFGDVVVDAIEIAPNTIGSIVGAIMGGIPGSVAGGSLGEAARLSFGRYIGTYDGDISDIAMDAGLEGVFNLMGEVSSKGGRAGLKMLSKTDIGQNIGRAIAEFSANASQGVKNTISKLLNFTTGMSSVSTDTLVNEGAAFSAATKELKQIAKVSKTPAAVKDAFVRRSTADMDAVLSDYQPKLFKQFDKLEKDMMNTSDIGAFSYDATSIKNAIFAGGNIGDFYKVEGLAKNDLFSNLIKKEGGVFKVVSGKKFEKITKNVTNLDDQFVLTNVRNKLSKFVDNVNNMKFTNLKGKAGAEVALKLKRSADELYFGVGHIDDNFKTAIQPYTLAIRESIADTFKNVSTDVANKYSAMNLLYMNNADFLLEANRVLGAKNTTKSLESVVQTLRGRAGGENTFMADMVKRASEITGSKDLGTRILARDAVVDFDSYFPHFNLSTPAKMAIIGGSTYAASQGVISPEAVAGIGVAMSPKLAAKAVRGLLGSGAAVKRAAKIAPEKALALSDRLLKFNAIAKALPKAEKMKVWADADLIDILTGGIVSESAKED